jgi:hypothetical protein
VTISYELVVPSELARAGSRHPVVPALRRVDA